MPPQAVIARKNAFNALDDGILVLILAHLDPLPDLFSARAVCKRFRRLSYDQRLSLHVLEGNQRAGSGLELRSFTSLAAAVAASKPGDTLKVHSGRHVCSDVALRWPLQVVGVDPSAVLYAPRGADAVIRAFATSRLADLFLTAELGACVQHSAGNVLIERCTLQCADHPLEHLVTPLVSLVAPATAAAAKSSVLSVAETKLEGGAGAIRCLGTGAVQSTRTIYFSHATPSFWFQVIGDPSRTAPLGLDSKGKGLEKPAALCVVKATSGPFLYATGAEEADALGSVSSSFLCAGEGSAAGAGGDGEVGGSGDGSSIRAADESGVRGSLRAGCGRDLHGDSRDDGGEGDDVRFREGKKQRLRL